MITVRAFYQVWNDAVGVFIRRDGSEGRERLGETGWETFAESLLDQPSFTIGLDQAQRLIDDLWASGVRPSETRDRDAQGRHLADMRAIAFAKLNIEKP